MILQNNIKTNIPFKYVGIEYYSMFNNCLKII